MCARYCLNHARQGKPRSITLTIASYFLVPSFWDQRSVNISWPVRHSPTAPLQVSHLYLSREDGFFQTASTGNTGNGTSNNSLTYVDTAGNTYNRQVNAVLNNITFDQEGGSLAPSTRTHFPSFSPQTKTFGDARLPGGRTVGR